MEEEEQHAREETLRAHAQKALQAAEVGLRELTPLSLSERSCTASLTYGASTTRLQAILRLSPSSKAPQCVPLLCRPGSKA
eukprot:1162036-Pelagomonas_calceolata.AAC.8